MGLDESNPSDSSTQHANIVLDQTEDNVSQKPLEMGLHLQKVEVRFSLCHHQLSSAVEEVEVETYRPAHMGLPFFLIQLGFDPLLVYAQGPEGRILSLKYMIPLA